MPASFPLDEWRAFLRAARAFFPSVTSDEALFDPQKKLQHFDWSWQAVRYRYRTCAECNDEFKALLNNASEMWRSGWGDDEELIYKLERCIYQFFMSALSVFESFGFCLYFLGGALRPGDFPFIATPKKITLDATHKALAAAFPDAAITAALAALVQKPEFTAIKEIRDLLGHRLSGRRGVRVWSDGTNHSREETWDVPGSSEKLKFDENMLQREIDEMTNMLATLTPAAREFAGSQDPAKAAL
ncbi:MAG: hypothetical protein ACRD2G_20350 [Terriglobia bacterium]